MYKLISGHLQENTYLPGLDGPQKDQVGWRGYLNPKSGSPASILGSPAICSKKAKRFFFPLIMLVMVVTLFSSILLVSCLRDAIFFFFLLPFCTILVGNFPRIQLVQRDYLNPTSGSPIGLFLEIRSPGRWDYAICWALLTIIVIVDVSYFVCWSRVLARISKMPVQNSNSKISACPDLATHLLHILIPATFNNRMCQKGEFTLQVCPRR